MDNAGPFAAGANPYRTSSSASASASASSSATASGEEKQASFEANKAQYEDQEWLQRWVFAILCVFVCVCGAPSVVVPSYDPTHDLLHPDPTPRLDDLTTP